MRFVSIVMRTKKIADIYVTGTNNESVRTTDTKMNQKWLIFLFLKNHPKRKDGVCNEGN